MCICVRVLDSEGEMNKSLIDKTIINTEMDLFPKVCPVPPDLILPMDRQESKESTELSKFTIENSM